VEETATPSTEEVLQADKSSPEAANRVVTAKRINHVWHVDLTLASSFGAGNSRSGAKGETSVLGLERSASMGTLPWRSDSSKR
jgi:hypothetical protein